MPALWKEPGQQAQSGCCLPLCAAVRPSQTDRAGRWQPSLSITGRPGQSLWGTLSWGIWDLRTALSPAFKCNQHTLLLDLISNFQTPIFSLLIDNTTTPYRYWGNSWKPQKSWWQQLLSQLVWPQYHEAAQISCWGQSAGGPHKHSALLMASSY